VLAIVFGLYWYLAGNLLSNLDRQGIRTDFGFLEQPAGFAIVDSDFDSRSSVRGALRVGVGNTLKVAGLGIVLATVLGIAVGIGRLSRNFLVRRATAFYVETLRNVPVVVVIIFTYTAVVLKLPDIEAPGGREGVVILSNSGVVVPSLRSTGRIGAFAVAVLAALVVALLVARWRTVRSDRTGETHHRVLWAAAVFASIAGAAYAAFGTPIGLSLPERDGLVVTGGIRLGPEFAALLIALVLYTASHIAEIVRGSIQAIPRGQSEAATALGLTEFQRTRFVVFPQAMRIMIPPLANQYLNLTKNSSLAVFIAFPEITRVTGIVISQGNPAPQAIVVLMMIYVVISLSISLVTNVVNRTLRLEARA
jgi:general L-amino acid transport system permease protein